MSKQPIRFNDEQTRRTNHPAQPDYRESQATAVPGAVLVSHLLYAVLIVGFLGYYLDKALQIVRQ